MGKVYTNFPFRLTMTKKIAIKEIVDTGKYKSVTDFINQAIDKLIKKEGGNIGRDTIADE